MTVKTVLITGCSSGIGRALTEAFLLRGYRVYAAVRTAGSLQDLQHAQLRELVLDVNNPDAITSAIAHIEADSGYLNTLVNNAGFAAMGPVLELDNQRLQQQFATNVFAPVALTRACLPLLRQTASAGQPAQVVNIGSISGITTTPFSGAYCASKAALHSLSDALRMELAPFNIQVITVQPGAIESKFGDNSLASLSNLITDDSLYAPLRPFIQARAMASQQNPTPAQAFAEILVQRLDTNPAAVLRIGNGSRVLPLLKWLLPTRLLDRILRKRFGLL